MGIREKERKSILGLNNHTGDFLYVYKEMVFLLKGTEQQL